MISTLIIDDEADSREILQSLIESDFPHLKLKATADSVASGLEAVQEFQPDLVFLDIQMPDGTGFDLLEQVKQVDFEVVFVTAFDTYAIQAFQYSAYAYLMKPVDLVQLEQVMQRLEKHLGYAKKSEAERLKVLSEWYDQDNQQVKKVVLENFDGFNVLYLKDIIYLQGDGNCTRFYTESGKSILVTRTLKEYERLLEAHGFYRIHKSFLINLRHVQSFQRSEGGLVILSGQHQLQVSRRRKKGLMDQFL